MGRLWPEVEMEGMTGEMGACEGRAGEGHRLLQLATCQELLLLPVTAQELLLPQATGHDMQQLAMGHELAP